MLRTLGCCLVICALFAFLGRPAAAEECRYDIATKSFLGDCKSGASTGQPASCGNSSEAKIAVDWVFRDAGATRTFQRFRSNGSSPLDAVIGAQGHNPQAQQALRSCAGWAANYISQAYGGIGAPDPATNGVGPMSCAAPPAGLCYNGCEVSCPAGFKATCSPGITWNEQCWKGPVCDCRRP